MINEQIRVLIVEDNPITAQNLKEILGMRGFAVVGVADTYQKGVDLYSAINPDILLMDVKLNGTKTGIDLARYIRSGAKECPVVYLTANSDMMTKSEAFDTDPEVFLTKPFSEENLTVCLELAFDKFNKKRSQDTDIQSSSLFVKSGDRLFKIRLSNMCYLQAEGSYTKIVMETDELIQTGNLSSFESRLQNAFIRIHRSFIVNKQKIESLDANHVYLQGGITLPIGRKFRDNIKRFVTWR